MQQKDACRFEYTAIIHRIVKEALPTQHVRREEIRLHEIEEGQVHGSKDGEHDDDAHGGYDGTNGVFRKQRQEEGKGCHRGHGNGGKAKGCKIAPQYICLFMLYDHRALEHQQIASAENEQGKQE